MHIEIEYDDDNVRSYTPLDNTAILKGHRLILITQHPEYGEHFKFIIGDPPSDLEVSQAEQIMSQLMCTCAVLAELHAHCDKHHNRNLYTWADEFPELDAKVRKYL